MSREIRNSRGDRLANSYECPDCMFVCGVHDDQAALMRMISEHMDSHIAPFDVDAFHERWGPDARLVAGALEWQPSPDYPPRPRPKRRKWWRLRR